MIAKGPGGGPCSYPPFGGDVCTLDFPPSALSGSLYPEVEEARSRMHSISGHTVYSAYQNTFLMRRWIRVKSRLEHMKKKVIVWSNTSDATLGKWSNDDLPRLEHS